MFRMLVVRSACCFRGAFGDNNTDTFPWTMYLLGYLRQTPPEQFELDKFLAAAIISVLIGILTLGFGWDYTTAQEWLGNGAITLYIYWIAKIIAIKVGWIKLPQLPATPPS